MNTTPYDAEYQANQNKDSGWSEHEAWRLGGLRDGYLAAKAEPDPVRQALLVALKQIALGQGRYSRDHLEHCTNTVENMKALANAALTLAEKEA